MSRVRDEDLVRLGPLLSELRALEALRERRPGTFTRGSAAFLHFRAFATGLAADLKADDRWLRYDVERAAGRRILLRDIGRVLRGHSADLAGEPT